MLAAAQLNHEYCSLQAAMMSVAMDNQETQPMEWTPTPSMSPVRPMGSLNSPSAPEIPAHLKRVGHIMGENESTGEHEETQESPEEESSTDDECVEPIIGHAEMVQIIDSGDECIMSPQKGGAACLEPPNVPGSSAPSSALSDPERAPASEAVLPQPPSCRAPEPTPQVGQQAVDKIEQFEISDSEEEGKDKTSKGTFQDKCSPCMS